MNKEIWKPIEDFKDKYEISSFGNIRNIRTGTIYKRTNQYGDYFRQILYNESHKRTILVHREVATAFIPNPNNLPEINHKDGNKQNNCVDNLEWCDRGYNQRHALENGLNTMDYLNKHNKNKSYRKYGYIYQYDKNMNFIAKYYSPLEASKETGVCHRNILQVINHQQRRKQAGGYIWLCEKEVMNNEI